MGRVFARTVGRAMSANFAVVKFGKCVAIANAKMGAGRTRVIHSFAQSIFYANYS